VTEVLAAGPTLPPASTLRHFHVLAKPTGAICNLDCKYCFFLSKERLYPGDRFRTLAIEHNGDVYSCDHFVEPRHLLGKHPEGVHVAAGRVRSAGRVGRAKRDTLPRYCRE
jgi:sulfatase maturation enzyme AslB (radical SAM superfamily)